MSKDELPSIEDFNRDDNLPSVEDYAEEKAGELPSVEDYAEEKAGELPSIKDFIAEEKAGELPSVEDYIEEKEEILTEATQTIEDADGNSFTEVKDIVPPWPELVKMINDIREDIPNIPEIKYYDKELKDLAEQISRVRDEILEVPEVRYYEKEVETICEQIDLVREQIKDLPEVKYYDEQVDAIEDRIDTLQTEVINLPEIKYYDKEIEAICSSIDQVRSEIPTFPKWINEVDEVPDFSWIDKTFRVVDEDFAKVKDSIGTLKENIQLDIEKLVEENEVKHFENSVQFGTEVKDLDTKLSEEKDKIWKELHSSSMRIWEYHKEFKDDDKKLKKQVKNEYNSLKNQIEERLVKYNVDNVKTDELLLNYFNELKEEVSSIVIPEVKYYDNDIKGVKTELKELKNLVKLIKVEQKELQEGLLNEPPDKKLSVDGQSDPLTPIDRQFPDLKTLADHYRLFITRTQQQLATMGGGGEVRLEFLDDLDRDTALVDGKFLKYQASTKTFVGADASGGDSTLDDVLTAGNTSSIGMSVGFITATNIIASTATFSGNVNVGGTITYDDVTNVDSLGLGTFRSGVEVNTGTAQTALIVRGDARVTGVLTVGEASVTIDGDNNIINVGIVTISNSEVVIGQNVIIKSGATGINSAPNVFYVAKDGNDINNGTSIDNAKLTIASAVGVAQSGSVIKVLSGNYVESNPITVPAFVSVVGDDLRSVKVLPNNTTSDLFHVNKGCKLANMTFSGHLAPAAAVAFPTGIATNVGGGKWKGPYIQNCTSDTTTGTGIRIDGDKAVLTKSMNVDAFTQYNQGGVGVAVTNEGYAQLVSVFTICCDKAITVHKGGQADLANSNCSFGTFGLVADGISPLQFTGIVTANAAVSQDNVSVNLGTETTRPYDGQLVYFDQLYKSVRSISITSGGSGYTSTPSVTVSSPTGPNGEVTTAFATIKNGVVTKIDIISSGSQYTGTATVTISAPDTGNTATATSNMENTYYTINSSTPITAGITTLTLAENLLNTVGIASTAYFFQQSKIIASSHTFEYIGSGNDITTATPKRGGVTIQENEVVSQNGGRVIYTSTDQAGNFRIGDELQINQNTGTISGRAFSKSLFSEMTPFILALS